MNQQIKPPLRVGIFESDSYRIAKDRFGDSRLMEDIESQFALPLGKNPYYGDPIPFTRELFGFRTQAFYPRVPSFRIVYRYSPEIDPFNAELLSIELADNTPYEENDA